MYLISLRGRSIKNPINFKNVCLIGFPAILSMVLLFLSYKAILSVIEVCHKVEPFVSLYLHGSPLELADTNSYISADQLKLDILHYDLNFNLYPESKSIAASVVITAKLKENLENIELNFSDNYKISSITFNDNLINYERNENKIIIKNEKLYSQDTFYLKIDYSGKPVKIGLNGLIFGEINNKSLVYTMSEPNYASTWFPCNDLPLDKAMLDIHITNDSSKISVSNGKLISVINQGNRRTFNWKTLYPISTYLICIYSADYVEFGDEYITEDKSDTMKISYYVLPEQIEKAKIDFREHPKMIRVFSELFGEYPFINEKYGIAEFLWYLGAMEHQTITGIPPGMIGGKEFYKDVFVHELAHHWWGNAVGPKSWKDIWLNEGFSTYSEALYFENIAGVSALKSTMLGFKQSSYPGTLSEPGKYLFNSTVYNKGAWLLHMLRFEIGDSAFFRSLKNYYEKFRYSSASTKDFINICEITSGKNLSIFFNQWLNRNDYITMNYSWEFYSAGSNQSVGLKIVQEQDENSVYSYPLIIQLKFNSGEIKLNRVYVNKKQEIFNFEVDEKPAEVILDPDMWLLAEINEMNSEK